MVRVKSAPLFLEDIKMESILKFFSDDSNTLLAFLKTLLITLVVLLIVVSIINTFFKRAIKRAVEQGRDYGYLKIIKYILLVIIYLAAFTEIVNVIPALNSFLKTLLAGSGVAAIILSVAAQEPIGNLVSGKIHLFFKAHQSLIQFIDGLFFYRRRNRGCGSWNNTCPDILCLRLPFFHSRTIFV